ncbi:uncharacterized protein V2V93DRAFT_375427 [Kockiozyma suomiensis]|uniref:uncharacterized protein n=1 Tax=Kockiozyma suomiensis TaxID=1337062 RepID=UPI00334326BC
MPSSLHCALIRRQLVFSAEAINGRTNNLAHNWVRNRKTLLENGVQARWMSRASSDQVHFNLHKLRISNLSKRLYSSDSNEQSKNSVHTSEFVIDVESTPSINPDDFTKPVQSIDSDEAPYFNPDAETYSASETDVVGGVEYHLHDGEYELDDATSANAASSDGSTAKDDELIDSTPWYLRVAESLAQTKVTNVAALPEMPDNSPDELEPILAFLVRDLGLQELSVIDLRGVSTVFGGEAIMVVSTARSERHLNRAAEQFRVFLKRTYRVKPIIEGLVGKERVKVQERRIKKKLSRYTGDVTSYENDLRSLNKNSWVFFDSKVSGIHVHIITGDKRWELDLEGLWIHEIPLLNNRLAGDEAVDLVYKEHETKRQSRKIARKWASKGGLQVDKTRPQESQEYKYFTLDDDRMGRPLTPGFHPVDRSRPPVIRRGFHTQARRLFSTVQVQSLENYEIFDPLLYEDGEFDAIIDKAKVEARMLLQQSAPNVSDNKLQELATQLCVAGEYDLLLELSKIIPADMTFTTEGDDVKSLLLATLTNQLLLRYNKSVSIDDPDYFSKRDNFKLHTPVTFPDPLESWHSENPSGLSHVHWRRQLEYLQVAHSAFPYEVPIVLIQEHLVRQAACGVPITVSDFYLGLTALATTSAFVKRQMRNWLVYSPKEFESISEKRFTAIVEYIRIVGRLVEKDLSGNAMHDTHLLTILYRACTQFDYNSQITDDSHIFPKNMGKMHELGVLPVPVDVRVAILDKIMTRFKNKVSPAYLTMLLTALAQQRNFDLFWKRWRDLMIYGVNREMWMWTIVASLVAKSGDVRQMTHFLGTQWSLMVSELTTNGNELELSTELVKAVLVCLEVADPMGVAYQEIAEVCGREDDATLDELMAFEEDQAEEGRVGDMAAGENEESLMRQADAEEQDEEDEFHT